MTEQDTKGPAEQAPSNGNPPQQAPAGTQQAPSNDGPVWMRWLRRVRSGFGVPRYELTEVDRLDKHVRLRAHNLSKSSGSVAVADGLIDDWVEANFRNPLLALLLQSSRNTRGHILLNLIVIGGGFATSGIAVAAGGGSKGSSTSWIVFSIGLVVALAGGIAQIFRPGYRATQRIDLVMKLREEGWAFANSGKGYDKANTAYETFRQQVVEIRNKAAQIVAFESDLIRVGRRRR